MVTATVRIPVRGSLGMAISQFANQRGIYFGPRSTKIHVALYRRSGGKIGSQFRGLQAAPILLLDHIGAKSGKKRTSPLMYYRENDVIAVAASKAGQPAHPAWFHNLIAHPDTTVQIGSETRKVRACVATDDERDHLWPKFVAPYPGYDAFQQMARERKIPIVILDPR